MVTSTGKPRATPAYAQSGGGARVTWYRQPRPSRRPNSSCITQAISVDDYCRYCDYKNYQRGCAYRSRMTAHQPHAARRGRHVGAADASDPCSRKMKLHMHNNSKCSCLLIITCQRYINCTSSSLVCGNSLLGSLDQRHNCLQWRRALHKVMLQSLTRG